MATVQENLDDAIDNANEKVEEAQQLTDAIEQLATTNIANLTEGDFNQVKSITVSDIDVGDLINNLQQALEIISVNTDVFDSSNIVKPVINLTPVDNSDSAPEDATDKQVINIPEVPDAIISSPPSPPELEKVSVPTTPNIASIVSPDLEEIVFPSVPAIQLPLFTAIAPVNTLTVPENTFSFTEDTSITVTSLMTLIRSTIEDDLVNGGFGLNATDEQQLFERMRDREVKAAEAEEEEITRSFTQTGFSIPSGSLLVAKQRALQNTLEKISSGNRDISLKRADLFVQARQFALQQGSSTELGIINFNNSVQNRALQASQVAIDSSIRIFNAEVENFNADLRLFETESNVFEQKIRAALNQLELFKAEIEANTSKGVFNKQLIDVFLARHQAARTTVAVFESQVRAVGLQADIEKLKFESYAAEVQGFQNEVQAKVLEFQGFESQLKGESAKADIDAAEQRRYESQVTAFKVKNDIKIANFDTQIRESELELDRFRADIAGLESTSRVEVSRVEAINKSNTDLFRQNESVFNAAAKEAEIGLRAQSTVAQRDALEGRLELDRVKQNNDITFRTIEFQLKALKQSLDIQTSIINGALGGINTIISETSSV